MSLRKYYETLATDGKIVSIVDTRVEKAASLFQKHLTSTRRLLDIGCGLGAVSIYLQKVLNAETVYGVDIAEACVEAARQKGVSTFQLDLDQQSLPFEDNYFDAIFAGDLIEHVINPDHLLEEVYRTLTDSGVFVLTTPNLASWYNRLALLFGWQPAGSGVSLHYDLGRPKFFLFGEGSTAHLRLYTRRALREFLLAKNFAVLDILGDSAVKKVWHGFYMPLYMLNRVLACVFPSLAGGQVVAAKKKRLEK